jgi:hypothetical protein
MSYIVRAGDSEGDAISISVSESRRWPLRSNWRPKVDRGLRIMAMAASTRQRNLPGRSSTRSRPDAQAGAAPTRNNAPARPPRGGEGLSVRIGV